MLKVLRPIVIACPLIEKIHSLDSQYLKINVAVAKKESIWYSGHPLEIKKFRGKIFQAAQLTHKIFLTLNHLCKIFLCCTYSPVHTL